MTFMLDTSVAIDLRDGVPEVREKAARLSGPVLISVIARVELEGGLYRGLPDFERRRARLVELLAPLPAPAFDDACAEAYRSIVEYAGYSRRKILDRMIAAQALVFDATLVTRNGDDFRDIPGLELLEW